MEKERIFLYIFISFTIVAEMVLLCLLKLAYDKIVLVSRKQICIKDLVNVYEDLSKPPKIIAKSTGNLIPINSEYELPFNLREQVSENEIKNFLAEKIAEQLPQFIEVRSDTDIRRLVTLYRARILICERKD